MFTDPGWELITAGADLGDEEKWEQETFPHPALCGQRRLLQELPELGTVTALGKSKDQGLGHQKNDEPVGQGHGAQWDSESWAQGH